MNELLVEVHGGRPIEWQPGHQKRKRKEKERLKKKNTHRQIIGGGGKHTHKTNAFFSVSFRFFLLLSASSHESHTSKPIFLVCPSLASLQVVSLFLSFCFLLLLLSTFSLAPRSSVSLFSFLFLKLSFSLHCAQNKKKGSFSFFFLSFLVVAAALVWSSSYVCGWWNQSIDRSKSKIQKNKKQSEPPLGPSRSMVAVYRLNRKTKKKKTVTEGPWGVHRPHTHTNWNFGISAFHRIHTLNPQQE